MGEYWLRQCSHPMKYHPDIQKAKIQFETTEIDPIVIGQSIISRRAAEDFQKHHGVDLWSEIQDMLSLHPE